MPIEKLEIEGFRGFSTSESLTFAIPDGKRASGLTIITGANNSGKSTIVEALRAHSGLQPPSFSVGARNKLTDNVRIAYTINGRMELICSLKKGSSETTRDGRNDFQIFVVPSRRSFNPFFSKGVQTRDQYLARQGLPALRTSVLQGFEHRLFNILQEPEQFNRLLARVLPFQPDWTIDKSDQGQHYLKFNFGDSSHTSDGMGEGIVSIFCILDALYDSKPEQAIVVDEPELSLHPALQKRLMTLFMKYASDRQIIISTHSPYFVDIDAIVNGANLVRVKNDGTGIRVFFLTAATVQSIKGLALDNLCNPHTFGLNARELFFLDDKVILVEGQEDVLLYPEVSSQVSLPFAGEFFGWGVGGAQNMPKICCVLRDLGFQKVAGILDGNQKSERDGLRREFPAYFFDCIPAEDIRTKVIGNCERATEGLLDLERTLKDEYRIPVRDLITRVNAYLNG